METMQKQEEDEYGLSELKPDQLKVKYKFFEDQIKLDFLDEACSSDSSNEYGKEILNRLEQDSEDFL